MARLILIRHAPVLQKGICYGRFDPETEDASGHVDELAEQVRTLRHGGISRLRLISSTAGRCLKIAIPLAEALGVSVEQESRVIELSMGTWEGRPYRELETVDSFQHWMANYLTSAPPGGECTADLERRLRSWLGDLSPEETVVAVTHGGVIRALRVILFDACWELALRQPVEHLHPYPMDFSPLVACTSPGST